MAYIIAVNVKLSKDYVSQNTNEPRLLSSLIQAVIACAMMPQTLCA